MILSPSRIETQLFDSFPEDFFKASIRAVWSAYRSLDLDCAKFELPEREYMRGHTRRANVEGRWRRAGATFSSIKVVIKNNKSRNLRFTLMSSGRISLTASAVASPGVLPREAVFRLNLVTSQLKLYEPNRVAPRSRSLYGILTHGWGRDLCSPGFASIVFPADSYKSILKIVSLKREFPDVWDQEEQAQAAGTFSESQVALHENGFSAEDTPAKHLQETVEENFKLDLKPREDEKETEG